MIEKEMLPCDLRLFDGEAGESGGQGDTQGTVPGSTRRGKGTGEYAGVVFGKQADGTGTVTNTTRTSGDAGPEKKTDRMAVSNTQEERRRAFLDLVNGEYKDIYTEETQRIIDRRFKETRKLEEQQAKVGPVLDMLLQRYKIDDGDVTKLVKAIEDDDVYWSEAAEEAGMSVEQYKRFQRLERENAALLQEERQRQGRQQVEAQLQKWYSEAEAVKQRFPDFDLNLEVKDPQFLSMLRSGVPVEHAYKVMHMDEIVQDAMRTTAADTEKRVVDHVRAKGARPNENGTAAQSAFLVKDDVSKLTAKDRAEIARRVARGEKIVF